MTSDGHKFETRNKQVSVRERRFSACGPEIWGPGQTFTCVFHPFPHKWTGAFSRDLHDM